jgi:hypothetical protein
VRCHALDSQVLGRVACEELDIIKPGAHGRATDHLWSCKNLKSVRVRHVTNIYNKRRSYFYYLGDHIIHHFLAAAHLAGKQVSAQPPSTAELNNPNLTFTGEDSPMSNLLLSVMGAFAQFERELIRERQREGITIARREGKYRGRKPSLTPARASELRRRVALGDSKAALAREFGISRDTLYRYVPVKKRRAGKFGK